MSTASSYLLKATGVLIALFLISCSIQKRHYLKGYHWQTAASKKVVSNMRLVDGGPSKNSLASVRTSCNALTQFTSNEQWPDGPACDSIILRNGLRMAARIIRTSRKTVSFKNCVGNGDERFSAIPKHSVQSIKYAKSNYKEEIYKGENGLSYNVFALCGFILGLLSLSLVLLGLSGVFLPGSASIFYLILIWIGGGLGVLGVLGSLISIKTIAQDERGLMLAIIGLILSSLSLLIIKFTL